MKFPVLIAVLLTSLCAWSSEQVFLDIEDDEPPVSAFPRPGYNWKNCKQDPSCQPSGWLDNKSKIKVLSAPKKVNTPNERTGVMELQEFVLVDFSYERTVNGKVYNKQGQAWIDNARLSKTKLKTFFGSDNASDKPEKDCPPLKAKSGVEHLQDTMKAPAKEANNQGVKDIAEALNSTVGQCVRNPAKAGRLPSGHPFDSMVLPSIKRKMPNITGPDGKVLTLQQVADIDALARTLYGEMAGCYKYGLQYPTAIAKIALNRSEAPEKTKNTFMGNESDSRAQLSDFARVLTTPSQFNVWMKMHGSDINGSLEMALCPPSNPNTVFWQNVKPTPEEIAIWKNTMRIATEAVLFPKKFKARTASIKNDIYDYNSGPKDPWGYKRIYPVIEGRRIDRVACMQVWDR